MLPATSLAMASLVFHTAAAVTGGVPAGLFITALRRKLRKIFFTVHLYLSNNRLYGRAGRAETIAQMLCADAFIVLYCASYGAGVCSGLDGCANYPAIPLLTRAGVRIAKLGAVRRTYLPAQRARMYGTLPVIVIKQALECKHPYQAEGERAAALRRGRDLLKDYVIGLRVVKENSRRVFAGYVVLPDPVYALIYASQQLDLKVAEPGKPVRPYQAVMYNTPPGITTAPLTVPYAQLVEGINIGLRTRRVFHRGDFITNTYAHKPPFNPAPKTFLL